MYPSHFSLRKLPFAAEPDSDFFHLSSTHGEALGHLLYAVGPYGGFTQLTGAAGSGKTTIVRTLLAQHPPDVDLISIAYPALGEFEFVRAICDELEVAYPADTRSLKQLTDALNRHLLATHAAGRRTILIVDEAQRLPRSVLEQVRLLTNLETAKHKLLRIILVGTPELHDLLSRQNLRQLASRITARYHLQALGKAETGEYIRHRLQVAGAEASLILREAIAVVHRHSRGNPRLINQLCDCALQLASRRHEGRVDAGVARQAVHEVLRITAIDPVRRLAPLFDQARKIPSAKVSSFSGALLLVAVLGALLIRLWPERPQPADTASAIDVAELQSVAQEATLAPAPEPSAVASKSAAFQRAARPRADRRAATPKPAPQAAPRVPPKAAMPAQAVAATKPAPPEPASVSVPIEAAADTAPTIAAAAVSASETQTPASPASPPILPPNAGLPELLQVDQPPQRLMGRLAQLWDRGMPLSADDVCAQLPAQGLQCRTASGGLDDLRAINRPAMLTLEIADGQTRRVLLRSLSANFASIEGAVGTLVIPNEVLGSLWSGEYTAIVEGEGKTRERAPRLSGR